MTKEQIQKKIKQTLSKEQIEKNIKEILKKDKKFDGATVKIKFKNKVYDYKG